MLTVASFLPFPPSFPACSHWLTHGCFLVYCFGKQQKRHVREDALKELGISNEKDALNKDLAHFGAQVLPPKVDSGQVESLSGPLVLQVCVRMCESV